MKTVTIQIPDKLHDELDALAKHCTEAHRTNDGATTHGALTVPSLLAMLAEDAGMIITRPGAWEAAHMQAVLSSHGYL